MKRRKEVVGFGNPYRDGTRGCFYKKENDMKRNAEKLRRVNHSRRKLGKCEILEDGEGREKKRRGKTRET